jgi:thiamine-phosphate pyrophosphorylase
MLLYYITDRKSFPGTEAQQRNQVLIRIGEAAQAGVDYIQLREKDLAARDLERLTREAVRMVRDRSATTKLLVNGRIDVALTSGADGVHLPADGRDAADTRSRWMQASDRKAIIAVSAHTVAEVRAAAQGADFAVFAPIFEKLHSDMPGIGLNALRAACEASSERHFAVLALGGVTVANAGDCLAAGAAGVAGIRLFQSGDIVETVRRLRHMGETTQRIDTHEQDRKHNVTNSDRR